MNVVIINKSDFRGGAAVVSFRLMNALREQGINASMLVCEKLTDSPNVHLAASKWRIKASFLEERLKIFLTRGVNRANLFKIDTASDGLNLYRHPLVKNADIICLNWVNQGMLSLSGLKKMLELGKPVIWTMHDMWCFTGICHHAGSCQRFESECGDCPLLSTGAFAHDLSYKTLLKKARTYKGIHFVAVSNWLARRAGKSSLLKTAPVSVIPNAFPIPSDIPISAPNPSNFTIVMGAARLDDPIKGLAILIESTKILKSKYPDKAEKMELVTFGGLKNPNALDGIVIAHRHLGVIKGENAIRNVYLSADAVISTSLYETLPGTLVEGQVYGCIPIAFDRGGQPDIIDHLDSGYLAEWNDDLKNAAENIADGVIAVMNMNKDVTRKRMFDSAKSRFDAPVIAQKYIELFNSLK